MIKSTSITLTNILVETRRTWRQLPPIFTPQVKLVLEDANHHRLLRLLTHALSYPGVRACGEGDRQLELASWEGLTVLERAVKSAEDMMCHSAEVGLGYG